MSQLTISGSGSEALHSNQINEQPIARIKRHNNITSEQVIFEPNALDHRDVNEREPLNLEHCTADTPAIDIFNRINDEKSALKKLSLINQLKNNHKISGCVESYILKQLNISSLEVYKVTKKVEKMEEKISSDELLVVFENPKSLLFYKLVALEKYGSSIKNERKKIKWAQSNCVGPFVAHEVASKIFEENYNPNNKNGDERVVEICTEYLKEFDALPSGVNYKNNRADFVTKEFIYLVNKIKESPEDDTLSVKSDEWKYEYYPNEYKKYIFRLPTCIYRKPLKALTLKNLRLDTKLRKFDCPPKSLKIIHNSIAEKDTLDCRKDAFVGVKALHVYGAFNGYINNIRCMDLDSIEELTCHFKGAERLPHPNDIKNLKKLTASYTGLTGFHDLYQNLEYLNISGNKSIDSLPKGMTQLKTLDASNCNLQELPDDMTSLEKLDVSCNCLKEIPKAIIGNLTEVSTWGNPDLKEEIKIGDIYNSLESVENNSSGWLLTLSGAGIIILSVLYTANKYRRK